MFLNVKLTALRFLNKFGLYLYRLQRPIYMNFFNSSLFPLPFSLLLIISSFFLLPSIAYAQEIPDFSKSFVESSKSWIEVDYVGDNIIGHKLDIFLPKEGKGPFPVIITIYGSAFFSNSSKGTIFQSGLGQSLLKAGYAVVSINHRSSKEAIWPAQIQDVKAAIRFIRANAKIFSLSPGFIGITGFSSGGHLSASAGTSNFKNSVEINGKSADVEGKLGKFLQIPSNVDAVVDWFGPTDFLSMDECGSSMKHDDPKSPESSLIGAPIQEQKDLTKLANPISFINANSAPFLIFHGDKDPLVPFCQSEKLNQSLKSQGIPSDFVLVAGGGHGPGVMIDTYFAQMIKFFDTQRSKKTLLVIDGQIALDQQINKINPDKISSMNVLKGEMATNAYGKSGEFGVIELVLKK